MQQHRHQPQLAQQQAVPAAHGTDVTDSQSIDDWAAEPLFGGAMEMELPMRFHDISKFRPVPDHQEVRERAGMNMESIQCTLTWFVSSFLIPLDKYYLLRDCLYTGIC